jgi:hypothetical protein
MDAVGRLRRPALGLAAALTVAVPMIWPLVGSQPATVVQATVRPAAETGSLSGDQRARAPGHGNLQLTVAHVVFGRTLHLRARQVHRGQRYLIRIDIWVAPNTSDPRVVLLRGHGVRLSDCSRRLLRPGSVTKIWCRLDVPWDGQHSRPGVEVVVKTGQGVFGWLFEVRVVPAGHRPEPAATVPVVLTAGRSAWDAPATVAP